MREKPVEMVMLFDFYGAMLTDKQQEFFDLYYNEDLSLSEIAENEGITRQGVRDTILRAENILRGLEEKLGFHRRYGKIGEGLREIDERARQIREINATNFLSASIDDRVREIINLVRDMLEE